MNLFPRHPLVNLLPQPCFPRTQGTAELDEGLRVDDVGPEILVIIGSRELVPIVQLLDEEGGQSCFQLVPDVCVVDVGGLAKKGRALAGVAARKLLRLRRQTTSGVHFVDYFSLGGDLV